MSLLIKNPLLGNENQEGRKNFFFLHHHPKKISSKSPSPPYLFLEIFFPVFFFSQTPPLTFFFLHKIEFLVTSKVKIFSGGFAPGPPCIIQYTEHNIIIIIRTTRTNYNSAMDDKIVLEVVKPKFKASDVSFSKRKETNKSQITQWNVRCATSWSGDTTWESICH